MQVKAFGMAVPGHEDSWMTIRPLLNNHKLARVETALVEGASLTGQKFWRPGTSIQCRTMVALRCTCQRPACVKVASAASIQKALAKGRDPRLCPAHDEECPTYSRHMLPLYQIVTSLPGDNLIVYDWQDLPGHPSMHFDATVLMTDGQPWGTTHAKRFEIDSKFHLARPGGTRPATDVRKDLGMTASGAHCLRLHCLDLPAWAGCVTAHLRCFGGDTSYTRTYRETVAEEEWRRMRYC